MKQNKLILFLLVICIYHIAYSQQNKTKLQSILNLEQIDTLTHEFKGLIKWGTGYNIFPDSVVKHSGKYSMRIEQSVDTVDKQFGCGVFRIPENYSGKIIELRGYMKMENVAKGNAGLFMRIDSKTGMNQIDNMLNRGINGTHDWEKYSIQLPMNINDDVIYFGAILNGSGKLWIDDLQILIDGEDISRAKLKEAPNYKALLDTAFNNGSNIELINPADRTYDDLAILGKLWGFLKYYHPAIAKGDINWDYELFRVMPKVINSRTKEARNVILLQWIKKLGVVGEKQEILNIEKDRIKFIPDLKWIEDETELGKDIVNQLKEIKTAKRSKDNCYLSFTQVGNPVFKNEATYKDMSYQDVGFRLLSLYRYWNIIQYLYPYKNLIIDDLNTVLRDFIPEFIKADNPLKYRLTLLRVIEKIHDTHANIWGQDTILSKYFGQYKAPCHVSFIENKAIITKVYLGADSTIKLKIGDEIQKVNGETVEEIIKRKLPIYSASNYPTKLRNIANDILRSNNDSISVTYIRQGQKNSENVKCIKIEKIYNYIIDTSKKSWSQLTNNIGYIYPGSIKNSDLPEMMKNFKNDKGIIIDFRCYPSDFIIYSLSEFLMPAPIQFVKFSVTNFYMPGMFIYTDPVTAGKNNPDYFKGKIVVIVNETTQSSAEFHSMAFRKAPKSIVIGSTTAGADGNVSQFYLPGGISTIISGIGVYYPDGRETQGVGIVPDIEIKPTVNGIINGKDELIEKAIELINDDN